MMRVTTNVERKKTVRAMHLKMMKKTSLKLFGIASRHTRATTSVHSEAMRDSIIAMANSFTLPKVVRKLNDIGIGVIGTA
eukprot:4989463-Ditylum_brightwellii.AAC.1